jgi:hypothetical protein
MSQKKKNKFPIKWHYFFIYKKEYNLNGTYGNYGLKDLIENFWNLNDKIDIKICLRGGNY